jgi:hypothetical protein
LVFSTLKCSSSRINLTTYSLWNFECPPWVIIVLLWIAAQDVWLVMGSFGHHLLLDLNPYNYILWCIWKTVCTETAPIKFELKEEIPSIVISTDDTLCRFVANVFNYRWSFLVLVVYILNRSSTHRLFSQLCWTD